MDDRLEKILSWVSTPSVYRALQELGAIDGVKQVSHRTFLSPAPGAMPVLGYARTAKIRTGIDVLGKEPYTWCERLKLLDYLSQSAANCVVVVEDCDPEDGMGSILGEISCAFYKGFGLRGIITNGRMHDIEDLPEDFPILAGSIAPSGGDIQLVETGGTVDVLGLEVREGDLIHGDRNGALVIPASVLDRIEAALMSVLEKDRELLKVVHSPGFSVEEIRKFWVARSMA